MPEEAVKLWKPEFVAPMTTYLCHEDVPCTGQIFEAGGGWFAQVKWARTQGSEIDIDSGSFTPEEIKKRWGEITNFEDDIELDPSVQTGKTMTQILAKL